jgi:tetratricopeptide (TPR) repeat protein
MDAIAEFGEETSLAECKRNFQRERHQRDYARGLQAQLEQRRRLLTEGNSAGAVRLLDDAMLQYPGEPEISLLLTSARGAFRDSEFLKQHRSQIAGLEAVGQYGAALALMEAARARYPGNTELLDTAARLRQGLQEQERKRLFAAHVSRVEEAIKSGDWDAAATRCEGAQRDFPEEAALAELFETVSRTRRETEERARLVAEERARRESEELARRQEESAIAKGRNDADALVRKGDYQGAVATLDRLASQHPGHPDIQRDREAAQGELERQRWQAEEQARLKLTEDRTSIPPWVRIDNVHFTLTGPSVLPSNFSFEINFWAHVERQRQKIIEYAKEAARVGNSDLAVKTEGPFPLQRGARISVRLKVDGLNCRDNHKWLTWTGEIGRAIFVFEVPRDAIEGTHAGSASIRLNGCQIARMSFVLYVGKPRFDNTVLESHLTSHRRGFASYASDDRSDVLARVQGMEVAYKGLKVFVDVIDLRSGQYWETEIARRIAEADVFYLFWCRHAILSEWVSKEWHLALNLKGLDFIDPVPLEGPEHATPPRELAGKHFNDPLLGFIAAAGGGTHA